jgi:hypothetical protein
MIEHLNSQMKLITEDIERYENYSDDEYDLYENHVTKISYINAKMKVH